MRVAAGFVVECIENAVRRGPELQTEPRSGGRFLLDERQAAEQKRLNLLFLAGLGFQTDI